MFQKNIIDIFYLFWYLLWVIRVYNMLFNCETNAFIEELHMYQIHMINSCVAQSEAFS